MFRYRDLHTTYLYYNYFEVSIDTTPEDFDNVTRFHPAFPSAVPVPMTSVTF